jgi:hypothetical protein
MFAFFWLLWDQNANISIAALSSKIEPPNFSGILLIWLTIDPDHFRDDSGDFKFVSNLSQICLMFAICLQKLGFINSDRTRRWIRDFANTWEIRFETFLQPRCNSPTTFWNSGWDKNLDTLGIGIGHNSGWNYAHDAYITIRRVPAITLLAMGCATVPISILWYDLVWEFFTY